MDFPACPYPSVVPFFPSDTYELLDISPPPSALLFLEVTFPRPISWLAFVFPSPFSSWSQKVTEPPLERLPLFWISLVPELPYFFFPASRGPFAFLPRPPSRDSLKAVVLAFLKQYGLSTKRLERVEEGNFSSPPFLFLSHLPVHESNGPRLFQRPTLCV